jgi:hypothetical protein
MFSFPPHSSDSTRLIVSNSGGGGERVLWTAIAAIQRTQPDIVNVVYTGDVDSSKQAIIHAVKVKLLSYRLDDVQSL